MAVFRFLRKGTWRRKSSDRRSIEGLLAPEVFQEQLSKERARTDRGGGPFSLLALKIEAEPDSEAFLQAAWVLSTLLSQRTRVCDTRGWFGDQVGVILPNTTGDKVAFVWPPIKEAFDKRARTESTERVTLPEVTFEVYAYPSDGPSAALRELGRVPRAR